MGRAAPTGVAGGGQFLQKVVRAHSGSGVSHVVCDHFRKKRSNQTRIAPRAVPEEEGGDMLFVPER